LLSRVSFCILIWGFVFFRKRVELIPAKKTKGIDRLNQIWKKKTNPSTSQPQEVYHISDGEGVSDCVLSFFIFELRSGK
jgi:hypothetical protein